MNENELNHDLTPPALRDIHNEIVALLSSDADENRYAQLNSLITQRDDAIHAYLAELDKTQAHDFAEKEIPVNEKLKEVAQTLLSSAKKDMRHFVRSQSAIKKYK